MPHFPLSIRLLAIGKIRGSVFEAAGREYHQRLQHYVEIEVMEIKTSLGKGQPAAQAVIAEGHELQRLWREEARQIALEAAGREYSSERIAEELQHFLHVGNRKIDFILGGAAGLSEKVLQSAHERWSLSKMTLPHELARIVLLEQLYRACTILRGEKYHK
ncbi:MAG: 23S rRNA (pseudouridine(1915)-N(3))-methyltransferase RlmH [bacterium]